MAEYLTLLADLLILGWLVGTWFYEGHHRRCEVLTTCHRCGEQDSRVCRRSPDPYK